jgi:hypothetical protein
MRCDAAMERRAAATKEEWTKVQWRANPTAA